MSLRRVNLIEGEFYHIYNRGNSKQEIFLDSEDYDRFTKLLYLSNSTTRVNFKEDIVKKKIDVWDFKRGNQIVTIGAWVLMPNHFHLYLTPAQGESLGEPVVSIFMKKLCTAYTMYFNKKYNRTGTLFEGPFKSVHVSSENQARYLFSYIHLNPVKLIQKDWKEKGIKNKERVFKFLDSYKWGSYFDYMGINRKESKIINRLNFFDYFPTNLDFKKEIFDWIKVKE